MDDARSGRMLRLVPAACIAAPVLWSVVAYGLGPSPLPMTQPPRRPGLAFTQHLVDLGKVAPSEEVFAHFDFKNRGADVINITKLVPSCGCLQPEMRKKTYYPGQSGHFLLRVQTANQAPGQKEYTVNVQYTDPEPQEAKVVFRLVLPDNQVIIRPPALLVYQWSDHPQETSVDVIDRRGKSLRIESAQCTRSQLARVAIGEAEVDQHGHTHNRLRVTIPGGLPPDRMEAVIRVYTDDPIYRVLRVPLVIQGKPPAPPLARERMIVDPNIAPAGFSEEETGK